MSKVYRSLARRIVMILVAVAALFTYHSASPEASVPVTITVHLSSFAFTPDRLLLRAGVPVRLHLINDSSRGHDFSAPALFAASSFLDQSSLRRGTIEVKGGKSTDLVFVPRVPGTYKVRCTHFLHSLFGMTAVVVVQAAPP